jgi:hypothetical protein
VALASAELCAVVTWSQSGVAVYYISSMKKKIVTTSVKSGIYKQDFDRSLIKEIIRLIVIVNRISPSFILKNPEFLADLR